MASGKVLCCVSYLDNTKNKPRTEGGKQFCLNHHSFTSSTLVLINQSLSKIREIHQNSAFYWRCGWHLVSAAHERRHPGSQCPLAKQGALFRLLNICFTCLHPTLAWHRAWEWQYQSSRCLWLNSHDYLSLWDIELRLLCLHLAGDLNTNDTHFLRDWQGILEFSSICLYLDSNWLNKY